MQSLREVIEFLDEALETYPNQAFRQAARSIETIALLPLKNRSRKDPRGPARTGAGQRIKLVMITLISTRCAVPGLSPWLVH
jgi:hypothetical protein